MKAKTAKIPAVMEVMKQEANLPAWLEAKNGVAHVAKLPVREDITEKVEEQLIVEYYNR
jgi:ribosomal protein S4